MHACMHMGSGSSMNCDKPRPHNHTCMLASMTALPSWPFRKQNVRPACVSHARCVLCSGVELYMHAHGSGFAWRSPDHKYLLAFPVFKDTAIFRRVCTHIHTYPFLEQCVHIHTYHTYTHTHIRMQFFDGASRGNPGWAGSGAVLLEEDTLQEVCVCVCVCV